ncbi:hypothetical protein N2152v2_008856 [Parachlorella kessleri]
MTAEDEVYELRLQLAKTQVLLHEANAARHAAEQDLKHLRAAQPQTDKERECQSLRSMLRAALDENVAVQAQLAAAEDTVAKLTASMQHQRPAAVMLGPRQPITQAYQAQQLQQLPKLPVKQQQHQQAPLVPSFRQASSDTEDSWSCKQQGQPGPHQWGRKEQPDHPNLLTAGQPVASQVEATQPIHLLKAKLAEVAAAADVRSRVPLMDPSQSDLAGVLPPGEPQHTTLSVSGMVGPPAYQPPHQQPTDPGLGKPAASGQAPALAPKAVANGAVPPTALQQVYKEISALQQRLKAAEEHFMVKAGLSRPASPAGPPRSRPLSPNHGPGPDWKLIRELKQRKTKVETMQLNRDSFQLVDPAPQPRHNARRRSRSQQEEVSRLLMAGMSASKNHRSYGQENDCGGEDADKERRKLKQGEEACCICLTNPVEVTFKPCNHDVCLECCNRMRAANVFKADVGIKCAMCRQYIEMYTDLNGNPSSVPSLRNANLAAAKSKAGRQAGADAQVSTSVPNPARLVPPVAGAPAAPRGEATWYCDKCRHVNMGSKAECSRCRSINPSHVKLNTSKDPLNCLPEEIVRSAKEKHHPNLNKAFVDAGTPWAQGKIGGTTESMRKALRSKGHERLMRVVKVLSDGSNMEEVALDLLGNYTVQSLLEATHKLRGVAHSMAQQGQAPLESFSSVTGVTAASAFGLLLRALAALSHQLTDDPRGVHCLVRLAALAAPDEILVLGQQMLEEFLAHLNQPQQTALLYVTNLVERLLKLRRDGGSCAAGAASLLSQLCAAYVANQRGLMWAARSPYAGPMVIHALRGALPAAEAFKMGWCLATSAAQLTTHHHGMRTLELLCTLKAADGRCSEMIRDLTCYAAKALQGSLAQLAARREEGGDTLVRALLRQLQEHREDDWVEWVIQELVLAGDSFAGDRDGRELLQSALSMPTLTSDTLHQHLRRLRDTAGPHYAAIQQQVLSNRSAPDKLPRKLHAHPSEVSPFAPPEVVRRFPHYLRDAHHHQAHPTHSMLKRAAQQPEQQAAQPGVQQSAQQGVPAPGQPSGAGATENGGHIPPGYAATQNAAAAAHQLPSNGSLALPNGTAHLPAATHPPLPPPEPRQQQPPPPPPPAQRPSPPQVAEQPAAEVTWPVGAVARPPASSLGTSAVEQQQQQQQEQKPYMLPPVPEQQALQQQQQQHLPRTQPLPPPAAVAVGTAMPPGHADPTTAAVPASVGELPQQQPPHAGGYALPPAGFAQQPLTGHAVAVPAPAAAPAPPPTPPAHSHGLAPQAPSPHLPADPASFFPRAALPPSALLPHGAGPTPAAAPAAPPQARQPAPLPAPPPLAPPMSQPHAPRAGPPPLGPAGSYRPVGSSNNDGSSGSSQTPQAAAGLGGFLSLPDMLAQLTSGGGVAGTAASAAAAGGAYGGPAAAPVAQRPVAAAAGAPGRPGGSYRPLGMSGGSSGPSSRPTLQAAGPTQGPPAAAQPAPAPPGYGYGAPARQPAQAQAQAGPPPPRALPPPAFAYMQQQAALPQQPAALFHPQPGAAAAPPVPRAAPAPPPQQLQPTPRPLAPSYGEHQHQQGRAAGRGPGAGGAAPTAAAIVASTAGSSWACRVCTYVHEGKEANYLACALCGSPQAG